MLAETSPNALVYQVLDEVLLNTAVPPGVHGAMFYIIDTLRAASAPAEHVRKAERISIEMHKLEWGLRQADAAATVAARNQLKSLAAEWIDTSVQAGRPPRGLA